MRILITYLYAHQGGVDRILGSIIQEMASKIDRLVWVLPESRIEYFRRLIPASNRVIYESPDWPYQCWQRYAHGLLRRFLIIAEKQRCVWLCQAIKNLKDKILEMRLRYLAAKHVISHLLAPSPENYLPICDEVSRTTIVHDFYWLARHPEVSHLYKDSMLKSHSVLCISDQTLADAQRLFPENRSKFHAVPFGSALNAASHVIFKPDLIKRGKTDLPYFYYPAAANANKNHILLFKTAHKLAEKGHAFKIVLTGLFTKALVDDKPAGNSGIQSCRMFFQAHKHILEKHIECLGYVDLDTVENLYGGALCVTDVSNQEGSGLVVMEALERGIPVICTDIPPFREVTKIYDCEEMIEFFAPNDEQSLFELMEKALLERKERFSKEYVIDKFSRRTWKHVADDYLRLMESL